MAEQGSTELSRCTPDIARQGGTVAQVGVTTRDLHALSFLLSAGGAAFIFPNTSVYPEATQRITTRPGTLTPLCDCFIERLPDALLRPRTPARDPRNMSWT